MAYTFGQLETLWINAGGSTALAPVMAAIALAESSGNPNATNPNDNGGLQTSWGLWQLSDGTHNQPVNNILNPEVNAQQAVKKYKSQGLTAWGTYTSGIYRKYMSTSAPSPVGSTTQVSGNVQDASWWNPLSWGSSVESGIESGLTSAFKAVLGPVLQWVWWLGETGIGLVAIGFGVNLMMKETSLYKGIESKALMVAAPEAAAAKKATAKPELTEDQKEQVTIQREEARRQRGVEQKRRTAERRDVEKRLNRQRAERVRAAQKARENGG